MNETVFIVVLRLVVFALELLFFVCFFFFFDGRPGVKYLDVRRYKIVGENSPILLRERSHHVHSR